MCAFFSTRILSIKIACDSKRCLLDNPSLLSLNADSEEILGVCVGSTDYMDWSLLMLKSKKMIMIM